jgi:hypothetical protein
VASWAWTFIEEIGVIERGLAPFGILFALALQASAVRAEPAAPNKVFAGPEGLTVAVVPLPPPAVNQVLVQVTGSGTVFDGKAIPHQVEMVGTGKSNFETTYHGRAWNTIVLRDGSYSIYLPGRRDDLQVRFDEKRTAALKPETIFGAYQKQKSDGTLQALAAFDRKAEVARQEKGLQEVVDGFIKSCGSKPAVKVDWGSLGDADIQEISVASYCGEPLDTMRRMCDESKEAKTAIADKVKTFSCTMGKTLKMELVGSTLGWTPSRSGTNLGDFARKYLEKAL